MAPVAEAFVIVYASPVRGLGTGVLPPRWHTVLSKWAIGIAVGQLLAVFDGLSATCLGKLGDKSLPMLQSTVIYVVLGLVYGPIQWNSKMPLKNRWYNYIGISLFDVLGSYLTVLAFEYTTATSYSLLTSASVFVVIPLSWWFLHASYRRKHIIGVLIASLGMVALFVTDKGSSSAKNPVLGDIFVLIGSFFYGFNSVWSESLLKNAAPPCEFLSMLGLFGGVFGFVLSLIIGELKHAIFPNTEVSLLRVGSIIATFGVYSLMPIVLAWAGSGVMQLSLLSVTLWAILARVIFFGGFGDTSILGFFLSVFLVTGGLGTYIISGDPYKKDRKNPEHQQKYDQLDGDHDFDLQETSLELGADGENEKL